MTFPTDPLDAAGAPARPCASTVPWNWVPIRSLATRHRPQILAHLQALGPRDRYLRFGHAASDGQIAHYVDRIDFERDEVFGIFNRRLEVAAMAHLASLGSAERESSSAEFGVSVSARARGRGWGSRLFERAVLHARNRGIDTLMVHALADNLAMLHIVRQAGARIELEGADATAQLKLQREDFASHIEALLERQVAEFDYGLKVHAHRVDTWLEIFTECQSAHTQARGSSIPPPV
jgi:ribosomal protein S18 acetylase RimI-like enzyme